MFFKILVFICLVPNPVFSAWFKAENKELSQEERDQILLNFQETPSSFQPRFKVDSKQNNIIGLTDPREIEIERRTLNYEKGDSLKPIGVSVTPQNRILNIRNSAPYNYLTNKQKREYNSLYKKFKNHPELRRSQTALKRALAFYVKHKNGVIKCHSRLSAKTLRNRSHILITDYTIPHPENRFFILYLKSGQVSSSPAAHGYGSNRNCPGKHQVQCGSRVMKCKIPVRISNKPGIGATSKGFFITDEPYRSSQATFRQGSPRSRGNNAIRLDGLQYGVNHNARKRAVVFHRADYYKNICSSSAGCPAIKPSVFEKYKTNVDGGALFYIHTIEDESNNKLPDCSSLSV